MLNCFRLNYKKGKEKKVEGLEKEEKIEKSTNKSHLVHSSGEHSKLRQITDKAFFPKWFWENKCFKFTWDLFSKLMDFIFLVISRILFFVIFLSIYRCMFGSLSLPINGSGQTIFFVPIPDENWQLPPANLLIWKKWKYLLSS